MARKGVDRRYPRHKSTRDEGRMQETGDRIQE